MSTIADEIKNLLQHVEDVLGKVNHRLSANGRAELKKMHDQGKTVLDQIEADAGEDADDVKADATEIESELQQDETTLSPSNPPAPRPTISAGVPAQDVTGSQSGGVSQS